MQRFSFCQNSINNHERYVEFIVITVFFIIVGFLVISKYGQVVYYWDEGFIVYDAWRAYLGEIPNWDYQSGYMGAQSLLIASVFSLFGVSINVYHALMGGYGLVFSLSVFVAVRCLNSSSIFAATMSLLAVLGYMQWWYLNPGLTVEILMMMVFVSLVLWRQSENIWLIVVCGLLCGIALSFKQSGVFLIAGSITVIANARISKRRTSRLERLIIVAPSTSVFIAYVGLRLMKPSVATWDNYLVLIPWGIVTLILLFQSLKYNKAIEHTMLRKESVLFGIDLGVLVFSTLAGVAPLIVWYLMHGADIIFVLREVFIRVPSVVDKGYAPFGAFTVGHAILICASLVAPVIYATGGFKAVYLSNISRIFLYVFMLVANILIIASLAGVSVLASQIMDGIYDTLWRGYLWWFIITAPLLFSYFLYKNKYDDFSGFQTIYVTVFLFSSCILAATFPWPTHMYVVAAIIVSYAAAFRAIVMNVRAISADENSYIEKTKLIPYWTFLIVILVLFDYQMRVQGALYTLKVERPRYSGWIESSSEPYIELANLIDRLPSGDSVYAFPNLAFSMFLSGRQPQTRHGNYLGNSSGDIAILAKDMLRNKVQWLVVSRDDYGAKYYINAGLGSKEVLIDYLNPCYREDHASGTWVFYKMQDSCDNIPS